MARCALQSSRITKLVGRAGAGEDFWRGTKTTRTRKNWAGASKDMTPRVGPRVGPRTWQELGLVTRHADPGEAADPLARIPPALPSTSSWRQNGAKNTPCFCRMRLATAPSKTNHPSDHLIYTIIYTLFWRMRLATAPSKSSHPSYQIIYTIL